MEFLSGHSDTDSGIFEAFQIFSISEPSIIGVFMGNGAMIVLFIVSIINVRRIVKLIVMFFLKIWK